MKGCGRRRARAPARGGFAWEGADALMQREGRYNMKFRPQDKQPLPSMGLRGFLDEKLGSPQFTSRQILGMLGPLVLDQFFILAINTLTTSMVSASGQDSVSATSLVNPLTLLVMGFLSAISSGGSVVVARYKGAGNADGLRRAGGQVILASFFVACIITAVLVPCSGPIVRILSGNATASVQEKAIEYLAGYSLSFLSFSVYYGATSVLRGIGDARMCLKLTVLINLVHLAASALFLNVWKMDILGTTLSFNIARLIGGAAALYMAMTRHREPGICFQDIFRIDTKLLKAVFYQGVPFGVEQVLANGGNLMMQTYMVQLGTASIAANAIAMSMLGLFYAAPNASALLAITVVGQCMGADNIRQARQYGVRLVQVGIVLTIAAILLLLPVSPLILSWYAPQAETAQLVWRVLFLGLVFMPVFWPLSNTMPNTLRAAGDAVFTSVASLACMWGIRVGLGYLLTVPLGFGIYGAWGAMVLEWVIRSIIFTWRFRKGKCWGQ